MKQSRIDESLILIIYFILKPFYLFESGMPQISDIFLAVAFVYLIVKRKGYISIPTIYMPWVKFFALVVCYQAVIEIIWSTALGNIKMLVPVAYYIFNFMASIICIMLYSNVGAEKVTHAICIGCFYSIVITAFGLLVGNTTGGRQTGFFNNPNQLGYYAMIIITVIALHPKVLKKWQNVVVIVCSLYANILSLSKASVIGLGGLGVCYTIFGNKLKSKKQLLLKPLATALICGLFLWFLQPGSSLARSNNTLYIMQKRILNIENENDSDLGTGRGYDRVFELGENFLWGMGEGAYDRFDSLNGMEVHSTYANTLVSYGLLGLGAYIWIFKKAITKKGKTIRNLACFSGLLLYFITHNGMRNTMFWITLTCVFISNYENQDNAYVYSS